MLCILYQQRYGDAALSPKMRARLLEATYNGKLVVSVPH